MYHVVFPFRVARSIVPGVPFRSSVYLSGRKKTVTQNTLHVPGCRTSFVLLLPVLPVSLPVPHGFGLDAFGLGLVAFQLPFLFVVLLYCSDNKDGDYYDEY